MKKVSLTFITLIFLVSGVSDVEASTHEIDENSSFEETQKVLEHYMTPTKDGEVIFDVDQAEKDGQSEFIIGSGQKINQLKQSYSTQQQEVTTMAFSLPVWGNWCGPGYGEESTKDLLDAACKQHDLDYMKYGYFDCGSDKRLMARILVQYPSMGFLKKQMAVALFGYFQAQSAANGCY